MKVLVPGFEPGSPPRKGGMMDRTTPHKRWADDSRPLHNDSSRWVASISSGDGLRLGGAVLVGIDGDYGHDDPLYGVGHVVDVEGDPGVVGVVGVALWVDVPLEYAVREVGLLQHLDVAIGRQGEVPRVPDVGVDREGHIAVRVVVPRRHVVTVEHPAL